MPNDYVQTSVKHTRFLKYLIKAASLYIPTPDGMAVSKNRFFELAAGEKAVAVLKERGIYRTTVEAWEREHGAHEHYEGADIEEETARYEEEEEVDPLLAEE